MKNIISIGSVIFIINYSLINRFIPECIIVNLILIGLF